MMKSSIHTFAACAATLLLVGTSFAQVRHPGVPAADLLVGEIPTVGIPVPDVEPLLEEDANPLGPAPLRYGIPVPAPLELDDYASWEVTSDGKLAVARLRLEAPGAYSLGVEFSHWSMPPEGKLFVYDDEMEHVFGAYTMAEQIPHTGEMGIEPFPGDSVIIEYSHPVRYGAVSDLVLDRVIYDYHDIFAMEASLDGAEPAHSDGGCVHVPVNCPQGDPFENNKRATVRTLSGGGLCSGMLINNTANDGTKYMYTANHCSQGSNTTLRFRYEAPGCGGGGAPTNMNTTGISLLANDAGVDGRLYLVTGNIPDSYEPYFSGWSRENADNSFNFGISMHHPNGNAKKLSIDNNGGFKTLGNFIGIGVVSVWSVTFQEGHTEGGSSGGPLWDQNNRIRGTLTGGPDNPCENSLYGRFHNFYNIENLGQWLDPLGTDPTVLDGFDPFGAPDPGQFIKIEPGLPGLFFAPDLVGSGDLTPGGLFNMDCSLILAGASGTVFVSLVESAVPFKGGTLYAAPILLQFPVSAPAGSVNLIGSIPIGTPVGTEFIIQMGFADPFAVQGVSLSNGLKIVSGG